MNPNETAMDFIEKNRNHIISVSDKIWEFAEAGYQEYKSSELLAKELEKAGFRVQKPVAGMPTALVASNGKGRPVIGIIGEYDAVPDCSQKLIPRREPLVPGAPGHGCGHNICGASALAGAIAVKTAMEAHKLEGTIKFFGCPAEELLGGKIYMVRDGVFNGVDAVIAHHPDQMNTSILVNEIAMNSVKFHFHGKISHASVSPEAGISALDAVELMNVGVNYLREHMIREGRIHYLIEDGGIAGHPPLPNDVPPYARSYYWIRAPKREQVDHIYQQIVRIAEGAATMTGTTLEVEFLSGTYPTLENETLAHLFVAKMREIGAPAFNEEELDFAHEIAKTISAEEKEHGMAIQELQSFVDKGVDLDTRIVDPVGLGTFGAGSADHADVSQVTAMMKCKTTCWPVGIPHHTWRNAACAGTGLGHKSLIFGSQILACSALDLLRKPELLAKVRKEWEEKTKGSKYKSPIPEGVKPPLHTLPQYYTSRA